MVVEIVVGHAIIIGFVEPVCRPVGLEVSVALPARAVTGMLKGKSGCSVVELGQQKMCLLIRLLLLVHLK